MDFKQVLNSGEKAFKKLHNSGKYHPKDIFRVKEYSDFIQETSRVLNTAISHDVPEDLKTYLEQDVFVFSALRTHAQLTEARSYLKDEKGDLRPYYQFEQKVLRLNKTYNTNYLEAEYQFAQQSSQSAANWQSLQSNTERYWLQYRTAGDDRVRISHRKLNRTTLPKTDPFWKLYYPPNGWRCRCLAIEVLAHDYDLSNSEKAISEGEKATTQIGKTGKNKLDMFRFNPGQNKTIFPPKNTYTKVEGAQDLFKGFNFRDLFSRPKKEIKTVKELDSYFKAYAKENKHLFQHGYGKLATTSKRRVNGFTDMKGNIALKTPIMKDVMKAITNINLGKKTTFKQEKALSTLHHEIMHNANKPGNMRLNQKQTRFMELANEFVARKRLPRFMETLGGKLHNKELTFNRDNTGYNTMVRNYEHMVDTLKLDKNKVIDSVEKSLINDKYTDQKQGLINAIKLNSNVKEGVIKSMIENSINMSERDYSRYLEGNKDLFKSPNT
ncbi:MAG: phage minor head protein [Flavobacteriales bacterium]